MIQVCQAPTLQGDLDPIDSGEKCSKAATNMAAYGTVSNSAAAVNSVTPTGQLGSPLPPRYRFRDLLLVGDPEKPYVDDGERYVAIHI